ncbi:MAG: divalent-cation tolerance protein CutA [Candidatus Thermoplasmatota archaeon]|nr:divalent-cation tolerance protein CutA [Candidatus Thermoplasmatota archaeon]
MDQEYIMVLTTTGNEKEAEKISKKLIEQNLGACVQILGPIKSTYSWEDELMKSEEWMCFIKTRSDKFRKVESKIKEVHSYENPEIIALPIIEGSQEYLEWVDEKVS